MAIIKDPKEFALEMAHNAGDVIRNNFSMGVMNTKWKGDHSPITVTDHTINAMVLDAVKHYFPEDTLIAEEGGHQVKGSKYTWVCDPVDGTFPFSHGVPICVFSLALLENGVPILGVIYDPFQDRIYFARRGRGAFLNDRPISVSKKEELEDAVIGLGNWKNAYKDSGKLVEALMGQHAAVMNLGSILYMGMLVASGEFSATIFPGTQPHDSAALQILIEEAGGVMTGLTGKEQKYDKPVKGHLAANPILHAKLLEIVKDFYE